MQKRPSFVEALSSAASGTRSNRRQRRWGKCGVTGWSKRGKVKMRTQSPSSCLGGEWWRPEKTQHKLYLKQNLAVWNLSRRSLKLLREIRKTSEWHEQDSCSERSFFFVLKYQVSSPNIHLLSGCVHIEFNLFPRGRKLLRLKSESAF